MSQHSGFIRVSATKASEVGTHAALEDGARALLDGDPSPRVFVERLIEKGLFSDAIRFMAHALPPREAVWWGCLCLWRAVDRRADRLPPPECEALRRAVLWVLEPGEETRRAAEKAGGTANLSTAGGCLAMAAFWNSGSMTASHLPSVPAPAFAAAKTAAGGILLASARNGGRKSAGYQHRFLELSMEIANSRFLWNDSSVFRRTDVD